MKRTFVIFILLLAVVNCPISLSAQSQYGMGYWPCGWISTSGGDTCQYMMWYDENQQPQYSLPVSMDGCPIKDFGSPEALVMFRNSINGADDSLEYNFFHSRKGTCYADFDSKDWQPFRIWATTNIVQFYCKGSVGGESFLVKVSSITPDDTAEVESEYVNVTSYATVTTDWQKIQIPLRDLGGFEMLDREHMCFFKIGLQEPYNPVGNCHIYIDNVCMDTLPPAELDKRFPLPPYVVRAGESAISSSISSGTQDTFDVAGMGHVPVDKKEKCPLTRAGAGCTILYDGKIHGMGGPMRLTWNHTQNLDYYDFDNPDGSWVQMVLNIHWRKQDVRSEKFLRMDVKGAKGGEEIAVGVMTSRGDSIPAKVSDFYKITTNWQRIYIKFDAMKGNLEWQNTGNIYISTVSDKPGQQTVWIDNICLTANNW